MWWSMVQNVLHTLLNEYVNDKTRQRHVTELHWHNLNTMAAWNLKACVNKCSQLLLRLIKWYAVRNFTETNKENPQNGPSNNDNRPLQNYKHEVKWFDSKVIWYDSIKSLGYKSSKNFQVHPVKMSCSVNKVFLIENPFLLSLRFEPNTDYSCIIRSKHCRSLKAMVLITRAGTLHWLYAGCYWSWALAEWQCKANRKHPSKIKK